MSQRGGYMIKQAWQVMNNSKQEQEAHLKVVSLEELKVSVVSKAFTINSEEDQVVAVPLEMFSRSLRNSSQVKVGLVVVQGSKLSKPLKARM